jgi:hypothetical protein
MDECACTWRISGESGEVDAVGTVISRRYATLWYGSHCLAYSRTQDATGNTLLRLQTVGHLLPAGFEAPILVLGDGGNVAQQLIARDSGGEGAERVQRLGRALFDEVARSIDLEAQQS